MVRTEPDAYKLLEDLRWAGQPARTSGAWGIRGHVAVISMRREAKRNAVDRQLADALDAALNRFEDDPDLWVGILTGTRLVFSAGSDLSSNGDNVTERGGEYAIIRRQRRKPLI